MNAIRIQKKTGKAGGTVRFMVHAVAAGRTFCGIRVQDLDVVDEMEIEKLPAIDGCRGCARVTDGWKPDTPGHTGNVRSGYTAAPAPGRMRKTGSLSHGTRVHRGSRLGG